VWAPNPPTLPQRPLSRNNSPYKNLTLLVSEVGWQREIFI
jgi:hypothetical protein